MKLVDVPLIPNDGQQKLGILYPRAYLELSCPDYDNYTISSRF